MRSNKVRREAGGRRAQPRKGAQRVGLRLRGSRHLPAGGSRRAGRRGFAAQRVPASLLVADPPGPSPSALSGADGSPGCERARVSTSFATDLGCLSSLGMERGPGLRGGAVPTGLPADASPASGATTRPRSRTALQTRGRAAPGAGSRAPGVRAEPPRPSGPREPGACAARRRPRPGWVGEREPRAARSGEG